MDVSKRKTVDAPVQSQIPGLADTNPNFGEPVPESLTTTEEKDKKGEVPDGRPGPKL